MKSNEEPFTVVIEGYFDYEGDLEEAREKINMQLYEVVHPVIDKVLKIDHINDCDITDIL